MKQVQTYLWRGSYVYSAEDPAAQIDQLKKALG